MAGKTWTIEQWVWVAAHNVSMYGSFFVGDVEMWLARNPGRLFSIRQIQASLYRVSLKTSMFYHIKYGRWHWIESEVF